MSLLPAQAQGTHPAQGALVLVLAAPLLWPVAIGPTPTTLPWLFSMACAALALLLWAWLPLQLARASLGAWILAASLSSLIGLVQYAGSSAAWAPLINITGMGEAFGNLRQRNQFATLTNIGLVSMLCWLAMSARPQALAPRWHVPLATALAMLMTIANAASSSRTGLLQLGMVVVMAAVWAPWRRPAVRSVLLAAVLAYGIAAFALPRLAGLDPGSTGIVARLQDGAPGCLSRLTLWRNVLHLIAEHPWTGWGWGFLDEAHFMAVYPGLRFCDILDNAHNLPLHLAVELGIPVALIACAAVAAVVRAGRPWRETDTGRQLAWSVLAVIGLHSLLEYPLWYGPFQLAVVLCAAWLWSTRGAAVRASWPGRFKPALTTAVVLALGWAGADYWRVSQAFFVPASMRLVSLWSGPQSQAKNAWLFAPQVQFAELVTTDITPANAPAMHALALRVLHYSPEPRVIE